MAEQGVATPLPTNFDSILNFRDVGDTINKLEIPRSSPRLKSGVLFRAARPDAASPSDRSLLLDHYHIRTIIDLRSQTEHIQAAKKYDDGGGGGGAATLAQPGIVPSSSNAVATPLKIPGVKYAEINLNGKGFERALVWKMSWSNIARLVGYMAAGYRLEGISVIGRNVMQPRGLIGLGLDTLEYCGREIKEVFDVLADERSYPVLVHCTQGKDRTGIIVLLVLLLCGVDAKAINADYVRSEPELEPEREERLKEINSIGLDDSFAGCPADFVESIVVYLGEHYGGVELYLRQIQVDEKAQDMIKHWMLS